MRFSHPYLLLAVALFVFAPTTAKAQPASERPGYNPELREALLRRVEQDQIARKAVLDWMREQNLADPNAAKKSAEAEVVIKLATIDRGNTTWLKKIIETYGWPGRSQVGEDGAHAAWLLVQHADHDRVFQQQCLALMRMLVIKGEVSRSDLAYLTDRVRVADNKPQVYGTQFRNENGKMVPVAIEDEDNVDKRRLAVGLPPLAEYRALIERMYSQKPK